MRDESENEYKENIKSTERSEKARGEKKKRKKHIAEHTIGHKNDSFFLVRLVLWANVLCMYKYMDFNLFSHSK